MSSFNDREKSFENRFAHDEEKAFHVRTNTVSLFAMKIGAELKLNPADMAELKQKMVASLVENGKMETIIKIAESASVAQQHPITHHILERYLEECQSQAKAGI